MPELLLTRSSDYTCGHCSHVGSTAPDGNPRGRISWEDLIYAADFLLSSGERRLTVSGGEPSLHPEFAEMTAYLVERGFEVAVSTAGITGDGDLDKAVSLLADYPPQRLHFLFNIDPLLRGELRDVNQKKVEGFLGVFGARCFPVMRLAVADFDLADAVRLISEYGMSRNLSLGLCHPIAGHEYCFPRSAEIRRIVERIFSFSDLLERFRIQPILTCGWPMCCFDDDHLAWLGRNSGRCDFTCGPTIGIGPDLSVWPCFPLNRFRNRSLFEFNSFQEIVHLYFDAFNKIKVEAGGIFPECDTCRYRDFRRCEGGCLAHNVLAFLDEEPLRLPEVYP